MHKVHSTPTGVEPKGLRQIECYLVKTVICIYVNVCTDVNVCAVSCLSFL